jgi:hypothetical protein
VLEILDPPGSQIGLHYEKAVELRVRYRTDDAERSPLVGAQVRFAIFGDPAGSTLSGDRVETDQTGVAAVNLTAGSAEESFTVRAQAVNAVDAEFEVSVSQLAFVDLGVTVDAGGTAAAATVRALLYDGGRCSALPPAAVSPLSFRTLSAPVAPSGVTLSFLNLLSRPYAVVGRVEDASGHLVKYGCVELGDQLVPPGSSSTLPLPMRDVSIKLEGVFVVTTSLPAASATLSSAWHALVDCPLGPAQALLDATETGLSPALASAIEGKRGAKSSAGCRPDKVGAEMSLDQQLDALLTTAGAPATKLSQLVMALDDVEQATQLTSQLSVIATGASSDYLAEHRLQQLKLGSTSQVSYDLVAMGLPIITAPEVAIEVSGDRAQIAPHEFTLGLPLLYHRAFDELGLLALFPSLTAPRTRAFVGLMVQAAMRAGQNGCAAVESLVCSVTGAAGCLTVIAPACAAGLDLVATELDAGFAAPLGADLTLSGSAGVTDADGDLTAEQLSGGTWTSPIGSTFSALRVTP